MYIGVNNQNNICITTKKKKQIKNFFYIFYHKIYKNIIFCLNNYVIFVIAQDDSNSYTKK